MDLGFDPLIILRLKTIQKILVALGILAVIAGGYYQLFMGERLTELEKLTTKVQEKETEIVSKQGMLKRRPQLEKELAILKIQEAKVARNLPSKQEIPTLLTDISNAGHEHGLEFLLFAPKPEVRVDIHAEVPVGLRVRGPFHETVLFMDAVSKLSRIVIFSDLVLVPSGDDLITTARATTFRFLPPKPTEKKRNKGKKGKQGKKGK